MKVTKKIILVLCSLFVLFTVKGYGVPDQEFRKTFFAIEVSQNASGNDDSIQSVCGLVSPVVKINENAGSWVQNFPNNKKYTPSDLCWHSSVFFKTFYSSYTFRRRNSIHYFPFYITYRRLTI